MTAHFSIDVTIDAAALELHARRHGFTLRRALESVLAEVEGRLADSVRFHDCVARVGSRLLDNAAPSSLVAAREDAL